MRRVTSLLLAIFLILLPGCSSSSSTDEDLAIEQALQESRETQPQKDAISDFVKKSIPPKYLDSLLACVDTYLVSYEDKTFKVSAQLVLQEGEGLETVKELSKTIYETNASNEPYEVLSYEFLYILNSQAYASVDRGTGDPEYTLIVFHREDGQEDEVSTFS